MKTNKNLFTNYIFTLKSPTDLKGITFTQIKLYWLKEAINKFYNDIWINLDDNQLVGIIFKIRLTYNRVILIAPLIRTTTTYTAIKNLIELCKINLDIRANNSEISKATYIIFTYHIFDLDNLIFSI